MKTSKQDIIRIALLEDDKDFLFSLRVFTQLHPELTITYSADNAESFMRGLSQNISFDVIFIDIILPGKSGLSTIAELRIFFPDAKLIIMTVLEEKELLVKAFSLGADGYLVKDFALRSFPEIVKTIINGGAFISSSMAKYLIDYAFPKKQNPNIRISSKERELLNLFSAGASYKDAAKLLGISIDGVKYRVKEIYRKLDVSNKVQAINKIKSIK